MIAEQRERTMTLHDKLLSYLRDKFNVESIKGDEGTVARLLVQVGQDYDPHYGTVKDYYDEAYNAIETYLKNFEDKSPGEDDRGKRLGKKGCLTLSNKIDNIKRRL